MALGLNASASGAGVGVGVSDPVDTVEEKSECEPDMVEFLLSQPPQTFPRVRTCTEVDGGCTLTEHAAGEVEVTYTYLFFWVNVDVEASADIVSEISCSGSYEVVALHYGGFGLQAATSYVEAQKGVSADGQALQVSDPTQDAAKKECDYYGPTTACFVTMTGEWEFKLIKEGEVVNSTGDYAVCGNHEWRTLTTMERVKKLPEEIDSHPGPAPSYNENKVCGTIERIDNGGGQISLGE